MIEAKIKARLEHSLVIHCLDITNESHKHAGHSGDDGSGQTHFELLVVSDDFIGCDRIHRQRMVYDLLRDLFDEGLHALSVKALTVEQFSA